jgi:tRNA (guanine-N7-)-methyltransferase
MSKGAQLQLTRTKDIPAPNEYVLALQGEYAPWALDEERAPRLKGKWREEFQVTDEHPLDLEIGTGNGFHFGHQALSHPERCLVGVELKYKPLIQSIRRVVKESKNNARICRYNARMITDLFASDELNDVFIHFPDPWEKKNRTKHRLIQDDFLKDLYGCQRKGGRIYFKTDSRGYFEWALEKFEKSPYEMVGHSFDLHHSAWAEKNFVTHFERLFLRKGQPIHYAELLKAESTPAENFE